MIVAGDREGGSSHPVGQGAENPDLRLFLQLCVLYQCAPLLSAAVQGDICSVGTAWGTKGCGRATGLRLSQRGP